MAELVGAFLFTDLVGSTAVMSSLDPVSADELRRTHFGLLREAVADAEGTEVKNLGDGIMVVFRSPRRALDYAVTTQQVLARHNRRSSHQLAVRMGIAVGDAIEEDDDFFGEAVIEAARLCAAAQGGQILATDVLRTMARRSGHTFANEREMELKGLPDSVVVWDVYWTLPDDESGGFSLPPRLPQANPAALVGRQFPSDQLAHASKAVRSDTGVRVALIAGEAGIGKTALAASFVRLAHRAGAIVLYGRCDEELTVAYQPFVEAIGHYVASAPDASLSAVADERLGILMRLVPELRRRRPGLVEARGAIRTPNGGCSSVQWPRCCNWRLSRRHSCSCSTTCTGLTRRHCSSCRICPAITRATCSWSAPTAKPSCRPRTRLPRHSPH